jgi:hypothetical protein
MENQPQQKVVHPPIVQQISIPNHYFNGIEIGTSLSDMNALLILDGQPQARLSMSYTMAKTVAEALNLAVDEFEKATDHQIMTMSEVKAGMDKALKNAK